jgi:hypothetical protein
MVKMGLVVGAMAVLTGCQDPMSALIKTTAHTVSEIVGPPVLTDPKNKLLFRY